MNAVLFLSLRSARWLGVGLFLMMFGTAVTRAANLIRWDHLEVPATAEAGSVLTVTAVVTNVGDAPWGGSHNLVIRDGGGTPVAMVAMSGVLPGQTQNLKMSYGLPPTAMSLTLVFQALEHEVEWFGEAQSRVVVLRPPPAYTGMQLSTTTFDRFDPARLSTTDAVVQAPPYRLRAKVIDGTGWGWHANNSWNTNGLPLDNPPPAGNYAVCSLYWVRYGSLYANVLEIGPERLVPLQISGSVTLTSNWFHTSNPPRLFTGESMAGAASYRLFALFRNALGTQWETSDGWNNHQRTIINLPPPGEYAVDLYWRKYDSSQRVIAAGPVRTVGVQVTEGPLTRLQAAGEIFGTEAYDEAEDSHYLEYSSDFFAVTIPTAGVLRVRATAESGGEMYLNVFASSGAHLRNGGRELEVPVEPGEYRAMVTAGHASRYSVVGELFPYAAKPVLVSPDTVRAGAGLPLAGCTLAATGTGPLRFGAPDAGVENGLPPGLRVDPATGVITGTPTLPGVYRVWITAANAAGAAGKWVTFEILPAAPAQVRATEVTARVVALAWAPPPGEAAVDYYEIANGPGPLAFAEGDRTSFHWGGLNPGTAYTFQVRAVSPSGARSEWATLATISTPATLGTPAVGSRWMDFPRTDPVAGQPGMSVDTPPDGILDEIIGVDQGRVSVRVVESSWSYPFNLHWTLWGVSWPDGTFSPGFTHALIMEPFWDYAAPAITSVELELSFEPEPGQEYALLVDDSEGHGINPLTAIQHSYPTVFPTTVRQTLQVGLGLNQLQFAKPFLVRYGKPLGSVTAGSATLASLGRTRGSGGTLPVWLVPSGTVILSVKDTVGRVLKAGPRVVWEVWDGINRVRVGTHTLGDLLDLGLDTSGRFQVGLKLDDAPTVWFNLDVQTSAPPRLAVDANRDGVIRFDQSADTEATSADAPYRFWVNDDTDRIATTICVTSGSETEQDDKAGFGEADKNCSNLTIDCERDLEDLTRLWIHTPGLSSALKSGALRLGLKWTDVSGGAPAIRLFRAVEPGGGTNYLSVEETARAQVDQSVQGGGMAIGGNGLVAGGAAYILPAVVFANLSDNQLNTYLLFEGVKAGKGRLRLVVLQPDGTEVAAAPGPWVQIDDITSFYERHTVGDDPAVVPAAIATVKGLAFPAPTLDEDRDYILFVHGYNLPVWEKERWAETLFKRTRHLGFKGRVGIFEWPCSVPGCVPDTLDVFDRSELRAWQSAAGLRDLLTRLKLAGYRVRVMAHSQGNTVVSEALRQAGPNSNLVHTYAACQGALAAHGFDPSATFNVPVPALRDDGTPNVYSQYPEPGRPAPLPYLAPAFIQGSAGSFVNFFNRRDFALSASGGAFGSGSWQLTSQLKPNQGYGYNASDGFFKSVSGGGLTSLRLPGDRYEIFAFIAEARSLAVGAAAGVGGVFGSEVDLDTATYGFGPEHVGHSAQFRSFAAKRRAFWAQLMTSFQLSVSQ